VLRYTKIIKIRITFEDFGENIELKIEPALLNIRRLQQNVEIKNILEQERKTLDTSNFIRFFNA
jgi:hypothetical protein